MKRVITEDHVMRFVDEETPEERSLHEALATLHAYLDQLPGQTDPTLRAACTVLLATVQETPLCGNSDS